MICPIMGTKLRPPEWEASAYAFAPSKKAKDNVPYWSIVQIKKLFRFRIGTNIFHSLNADFPLYQTGHEESG